MTDRLPQDRRTFLSTVGALGVSALGVADHAASTRLTNAADANASSDYLFAKGLVYLNTAAMGPSPRVVFDETVRVWRQLEENPVYHGYTTFRQPMEDVRARAATMLGCALDEMIVTHSTTEGMNAVADGLSLARGDHVLTTNQEHPGGQMCWKHFERRHGVVIDVIELPLELHDPKAIVQLFADAITPATRIISVSHVLSSNGMRMPIREIASLARARGCLCAVDGAQAVGAIEVNVKELGCHAYATSGHKWLMGPKGTGLLYLSAEVSGVIEPLLTEDGRGVYTESTGVRHIPGVMGLGTAIDLVARRGIRAIESQNVALRNVAYAEIGKIPGLTIVSPPPGPSATTLVSFRIPESIKSAALMKVLQDRHGVVVKTVPTVWMNGMRVSTHVFNTERDVEALGRGLRAEVG